ncbi:MAG: Spy/CpxP family protein refolding chaperone [Acidobacteriaceae bacterium]
MKRILLSFALIFAAILTATASAQDAAPAPDGTRAIRRIEARLNFTWDQRVQAKAILQQERPLLQTLHSQLQAEQAEMAELTTFDDEQARAIVTKYQETNNNVLVERAKLRIELTAILTPAQQKKLAEMRARLGSGMDARLLTLGDNL